jgi:hypothetical protein
MLDNGRRIRPPDVHRLHGGEQELKMQGFNRIEHRP